MDPNDPTRTQPAPGPPPEPPGVWPPPHPGPGRPGSYDAPPTAAYPVASAPAPPYVPPPAGRSFGGDPPRPLGPSRGLLITGGILALLLAGILGFIVGVQVEKGRKPATVATSASVSASTTTPTAATSGQAGKKAGKKAKGTGGGGKSTTGQVGAVSPTGFTISLPDGTSVNVVVSGTTKFVKKVAGSLPDVTPGTAVVVVGPRGQNGAITARMVTIG